MKKKKETLFVRSALEETLLHRERFNPYQCGTGIHESEKYPKRSKSKSQWKKETRNYY